MFYSVTFSTKLFTVVIVPTAWKVSKYEVISGLHFPVFVLNTEIYGLNTEIQKNTNQKQLRIWTVFTLWPFLFVSVGIVCEFAMLPDMYIYWRDRRRYISGYTYLAERLNLSFVIILLWQIIHLKNKPG